MSMQDFNCVISSESEKGEALEGVLVTHLLEVKLSSSVLLFLHYPHPDFTYHAHSIFTMKS